MPEIRLTCPGCWGDGTEEVLAPAAAHEADTELQRCSLCGGEGEVDPVECQDCRGEGDAPGQCPRCGGIGSRYPDRGNPTCRSCGGSGQKGVADCPTCDGVGLAVETRKGGAMSLPLELKDELKRRQPDPCRICGHDPCECGGDTESTSGEREVAA